MIESIAYQVRDVLEAMDADAGTGSRARRVDGGAAANDTLLQFQADVLGVAVERPVVAETTALGAACLAGLAVGFWRNPGEGAANWALDHRFEPRMDTARRDRLLRGRQRAVQGSLAWVEPGDPTAAAARSEGLD